MLNACPALLVRFCFARGLAILERPKPFPCCCIANCGTYASPRVRFPWSGHTRVHALSYIHTNSHTNTCASLLAPLGAPVNPSNRTCGPTAPLTKALISERFVTLLCQPTPPLTRLPAHTPHPHHHQSTFGRTTRSALMHTLGQPTQHSHACLPIPHTHTTGTHLEAPHGSAFVRPLCQTHTATHTTPFLLIPSPEHIWKHHLSEKGNPADEKYRAAAHKHLVAPYVGLLSEKTLGASDPGEHVPAPPSSSQRKPSSAKFVTRERSSPPHHRCVCV